MQSNHNHKKTLEQLKNPLLLLMMSIENLDFLRGQLSIE